MIDIPSAQIRATIAVGYRKITLGHMKIRIPCSRCGAVGSGVVRVDGFASVDITDILRAERHPSDSSRANRGTNANAHAGRTRVAILTPWCAWVKSLTYGGSAGLAMPVRSRAVLATKLFAARAPSLRCTEHRSRDPDHT